MARLVDDALARHGPELGDYAHMLSAIANGLRGDHPAALAAWQERAPPGSRVLPLGLSAERVALLADAPGLVAGSPKSSGSPV